MSGALSTRHLLGIKDLTVPDIELILSTADSFKEVLQRRIKKVPSLRDITVANIFFENSTRTRLSFELAEKRLSADVVNFSASSSSLSKGETLIDTVRNLVAMRLDMVVIRHNLAGVAHTVARHTTAQVINAGDGAHEHPTQALLDAYSLKLKFGSLQGLKIALIGDVQHSRVALSNIFLLKKMGAEVEVCGPPTLLPYHIAALGVKVSYNLDATLAWCDVANVLRIQAERQEGGLLPSLYEYRKYYGITEERLSKLKEPITIMHPGPINRGVELDTAVADGPYSIILDQVENGVAVRMAVLYLLASAIRPEA